MKKKTLQTFSLESLAPKQIDSNLAYYSEIINAGIQDNSVKNIAITGNYGAGKSSVLATFQKKFSNKYKYLNISLANFRSEKETAQTQSKVRLSILQQMFYHAHVRKIPDSRFKRIKAFSWWHTIFAGTVLALFLISFLTLFKPDVLSNLPLGNLLVISPESNFWFWGILVNWALLLFSLFYFIKKLYHAKFGIHSIKLNSSGLLEVNGAKKEPHLILNEHLDEILYLFERKRFNVVIIEDLDRFADIAIFEELRELNFLINNAKQLKKRKVTFIYALNDSLFELINKRAEKEDENIKKSLNIGQTENKKDNTNEDESANKGQDIDNSKKDCKPKLEFSTSIKHKTKFFDLIIPVIPFINVTNSYNFLTKRNSTNLSLAFLSKISFYIDDMRLLTNIMNEYQIYFNQIITQNNNALNLDHNQLFSIILIKNFFPEEFDNLHLQKNIIGLIFGDLKDKFIQKKLIELRHQKQNTNDESINNTINLLSNSVSLRTLVHEFENEIDFLTHNPLVDYLIESGYLTEEYYYYISLLHKDALSINDHLFVKQFSPHEEVLRSDFELDNPKDVYARLFLDSKDFESQKIFNCDLIHYLILNKEGNLEKRFSNLIKISQQLEKFPLTAKKMIDIYFRNEDKYKDSISYFTVLVCRQWENIWEFVETQNSDEDNILYARNILLHATERQLEKFKKNESAFIQYIEHTNNYYRIFKDIETQKLDRVIEILKIKFLNIDSRVTEKQIDFLLDGQYYQINFYNILIILYKKQQYSGRLDLKKNAYSAVADSQIKPLMDYINKNLDVFINSVMCSNQPKCLIEENEDVILEILNADNVQQATKNLLISHLKNELSNLIKINESQIWIAVLENNKLLTSWGNVIVYFGKYGINKTLKSYLEQNSVQQKLGHQITNNKKLINNYVSVELPISGVISSLSNNEDCLLSVLNDGDIEDDVKIEIIEKIENKNLITNIKDVNDSSLWEYVFAENLISAKLINVILYYQEQGEELDNALISYLNVQENYEYLKEDSLIDSHEVNKPQLYSQFLPKNSISIAAYQALLNIFGSHHFSDLECKIDDNTDPKKIAIAINRNLITLSPHNYNYLRIFSLHYYLVRKSYSNFIDNLDHYDDVDEKDLNVLLNFTFEPASKLDSKITLLTKDKNITATFINQYGLRSLIKFNLLSDESLVTDLLNNEDVYSSKTTELINELSIKIKYISAITNVDIQASLFEQNKVGISWGNIYHYYINCDKKINQSLIEFLNIAENTRELVKLGIDDFESSEERQDIVNFQAAILYKNEINDEIYFMFANAFSNWNSIYLPPLSENKVNYLINQKKLNLTDFNFKYLKEKFPNKHINLLEIHSDSFLQFKTSDKFNLVNIMTGSDYVLLVDSNKFKLDDKFKIIEKIPEKVIRLDHKLANKLLDIFKNRRNNNYSIDLLIKTFVGIGNEDHKIKLIIKNLSRLNKTELDKLLMKIPSLEKIGRCATATINFNKKYNSFFEELLKVKYLTKVKIEENKIKGKKQKQFKIAKN